MIELSLLLVGSGAALAMTSWGLMHLAIARNIWRGVAVPEEMENQPRKEWE